MSNTNVKTYTLNESEIELILCAIETLWVDETLDDVGFAVDSQRLHERLQVVLYGQHSMSQAINVTLASHSKPDRKAAIKTDDPAAFLKVLSGHGVRLDQEPRNPKSKDAKGRPDVVVPFDRESPRIAGLTALEIGKKAYTDYMTGRTAFADGVQLIDNPLRLKTIPSEEEFQLKDFSGWWDKGWLDAMEDEKFIFGVGEKHYEVHSIVLQGGDRINCSGFLKRTPEGEKKARMYFVPRFAGEFDQGYVVASNDDGELARFSAGSIIEITWEKPIKSAMSTP